MEMKTGRGASNPLLTKSARRIAGKLWNGKERGDGTLTATDQEITAALLR
jgi:hypothetical protein